MYACGFRIYFTPLPGFFSPFPHGTGSLSVRREYLALRDGPRGFPQGFSCPAVLRVPLRVQIAFAYVAITLYGPSFQRASANDWIGYSTVADPTTPTAPNPRPNFLLGSPVRCNRFRLFRFRSPLLSESRLISVPSATEMFQFTEFASASL